MSSPIQLLCSFVHEYIVLYLLSCSPLRWAAHISLLSCYVLSCYSLPFDVGLQLNFPCIDFPASTILTTSVQSNWDCLAISSLLFPMTAHPYTRQSTLRSVFTPETLLPAQSSFSTSFCPSPKSHSAFLCSHFSLQIKDTCIVTDLNVQETMSLLVWCQINSSEFTFKTSVIVTS